MAKSKFLKWQDKNGDNLIDVCEVDLGRPEEKICLDCIPNPRALVPKWRTRRLSNPFLNGKLCKYQITKVTKRTDTGSGPSVSPDKAKEKLDEIYAEYVEEAAEALLNYYDKDTSIESINKIVEALEYTDYDLDPQPLSHLKLLYSIPFSDLNNIDPAASEEEEEPAGEDTVTTYIPFNLIPNMIRVRKGLNLYSSNLKVYRALEGKNIVFESGGVFNLDLYGDAVLWGSSVMEDVIPDLSEFLRTKNYYLGSASLFFPSIEAVSKFECTFTPEFKLKQIKVWSEGCGDKANVYKGSKLDPLTKSSSAFKDPTAMAYFAKISEMERDLTARSPKPWVQFIQEYTYPKVTETMQALVGELEPLEAALGCIADSLANEGKQLGQDMLDEVFGIGDAIAAQFHKMLCEKDYTEFLEQEYKLGKHAAPPDTIDEIPGYFSTLKGAAQEEREKFIKSMALEQAYGEIEEKDVLMTSMCTRLLSICGSSGSQAKLDLMWLNGLDPIRMCGLFDMMLDAIQCLFKGLTFEEVLASMLKSALKAMSIQNFGDLFIGLPPDKQARLDELVKRKLESGDIAADGRLQDTSEAAESPNSPDSPADAKFFVPPTFLKPWENPELIERQERENMVEGPYEGMTPNGIPSQGHPDSQLGKATAVAQMESAGTGLSPNVVMEAYAIALLEEYSDDLLGLMAEVEKFPGAQIVAYIIATLDCPRPPLFDPSIVDFLKDIELPFCRNTNHIGLPRLQNPFAWLPKLWDIFRILWAIIKQKIWDLVVTLVCKLIVFLCELLGNAICKALETVGDLAASLPSVIGGRTTFGEVIKESLCGPDADQEQIEDTIQEMFNSLGQGSAALADKSAVMSFTEDLSSTMTKSELTNAILGNPSQSFLDIIESLVEFEHPEFADAFGTPAKAAKFFENVGNIIPTGAKAALKDFADPSVNENQLPANPTLCATPADREAFYNARAQLLEGRASPDQIAALAAAGRETIKDDLGNLGDIMQNGIPNFFEQNMPPIMSSDPTCDNGIIPFEPKELAKAATTAINTSLEVLKIAYSQDMLGNGPFVQSNWGFMNMVMSDTMGWAYTTHLRKSNSSGGWFTKRSYVDFNVDADDAEVEGDTNFANTSNQRGAFPLYVADHLLSHETQTGEMERAMNESTFESNNEFAPDKHFSRTFSDLGFDNLFDEVDLLVLPDYGYNVTVEPEFATSLHIQGAAIQPNNFGDGKVKFNRRGRKKKEDIKLTFRDNAQGEKSSEDGFSYGFNVKLYLSDLASEDGQAFNRPDNNARIIIEKVLNEGVMDSSNSEFENEPEDGELKRTSDSIITYRAYEFLSVDEGLDNEELDNGEYIKFKSVLSSPSNSLIPQVVLLQEMIEKQNDGAAPRMSGLKDFYDQAMTSIFSKFASEIYTNKAAFEYGAQLDDLSAAQIEYGMDYNGSFTLFKDYLDATETDTDDAPLGISRMQYEEENNDGAPNRVFYLDPLVYGGSYLNPAVYLKPTNKTGWLGMVDVIFPELSPCKPQSTDLVNFGSIQSIIDESYSKIPVDQRLKSDPDCVTEKPYNRILERHSKAGIEGLIHAMCRIFVSVNFLKSLATFTKFKPDFKNNFSSLYASYVVELMEEELKDAQPNSFIEFFSPFKDDEFWYAFLEQSVQTYARKVETGAIEDVPPDVLAALEKLQNYESKYKYPDPDDLDEAKDIGDAWKFQSLNNYRYEKNLEAIKETEELAKIVLKEFVIMEMGYMSEVFMKSLQNVGIIEKDTMVENLGHYILETLTANTDLTLSKELKEEVEGLPTEGDELYTNGDELSTPDGEPYTGYYHTSIGDEGETIYMVGEYHTEDEHDALRPFANKVIVPIGSIGPIGTTTGDPSTQPFVAETYIKIAGQYKTPLEAVGIMLAQPDRTLNISDVYPGTLRLKIDPDTGKVLGTTGKLGVRYGLRFSIQAAPGAASKYTIIEVEIDALDLPIAKFQPLENDSKLLLCLINNLVDDDKFKMLTKYIFPLNKVLSTLAIYNDMAFLPSIGEVTSTFVEKDPEDKPGKYVVIDSSSGTDIAKVHPGMPGWATKEERASGRFAGGGFFTLHFDKWNRSLLVKSKSRVKKMFKDYYNSRDFDPGDMPEVSDSYIASLRAAWNISPGERHFPWFKKGMLRSNPFNANGELCKKKD